MRHEPSFMHFFVFFLLNFMIDVTHLTLNNFTFCIIHRTVRGVPNHLIGLLPTYDDNSSDNSEDRQQMRQNHSNTTNSTTGVTTKTTTTSGTSGSGDFPYHRNVSDEKYHTGVPISSLDDHSTSSNLVEETSGGTSTHNRSSNVNGEENDENDYENPEDEEEAEESDQEPIQRQMMKLNLIEHNIMLPSELELKYKKVKNNAEMDAILIEAISPPPGAPPKSENPARLRRYHRLN